MRLGWVRKNNFDFLLNLNSHLLPKRRWKDIQTIHVYILTEVFGFYFSYFYLRQHYQQNKQ